MNPLNLDPNINYLAQPRAVDVPEWRKSLASFGDETAALGSGLRALGAQVVGATDVRDQALLDFQRNTDAATAGWQAPEVGQIEDIKLTEEGGLGRLGSYLGYQVPKGLAQLGSMVVSGLGAGAVARTFASKGIKELAKAEMKNLAADVAKKAVMTPLADREAGKVAIKQLAERQLLGMQVGATAGIAGMEGGQMYGKLANDPAVGPDAAVLPTLAYTGIATALEYLPLHMAGKAIGLDRFLLRKVIKEDAGLAAKAAELSLKKKALGVVGKIAGGAVAGAATEGITEGLQSLAEQAATKYAQQDPQWASILPTTKAGWSDFWNSAAAGGATGFFAGTALGPLTGAKRPTGEVNVSEAEAEAAPAGAGVPPSPQPPVGQAPAEEAPSAPGAATPEVTPNALPVPGRPEENPAALGEGAAATPTPPAAEQPTVQPAGGEVQAVTQPDGGWSVVAADGLIARDVPTEQETVQIRDQEIADRAARGQVVKTTTSPQEALPITPTEEPSNAQQIPGAAALYENVPRPEQQGGQEVQVPTEEGGKGVLPGGQEQVKEVIGKADGTPFATKDAATRKLNQLWVQDKMQIQEGPEAGKQARARVAKQGDGYVIERLESRPPVADLQHFQKNVKHNERPADEVGAGYSYNIPDATAAETFAHGVDLIKTNANLEDHIQFAEEIVAANPEALNGFVPREMAETYGPKVLAGFLQGVGSGFNPNDISYFLNMQATDKAAHKESMKDPRYSRLRARVEQKFGKQLEWVPSPETLERLDKGEPTYPWGEDARIEQGNPNILESRGFAPTQSTTNFVAQTDSVLGQGWTQRAIDAGILVVNETSPADSASGYFEPSTGKFVVNLDRTPQGQSPVDVLLHEGSHASMARMLGGQFASFHKDLERLAEQGSATAKLAVLRATAGAIENINRRRVKLKDEPYPHRLGDETLPVAERANEIQRVRTLVEELRPGLLAEEDLAYYIQLASSAKPAEAGYWRRLLTAIQAWIAQTNFGKALATIGWRPELSPQLAVELAKQAAQATLRRAELVNTLLGERAKVLRSLPAAAQMGVMEAQWRTTPNTPEYEQARATSIQQQQAVQDWFLGKGPRPAAPTVIYRGVDKEQGLEAQGKYTHASPWFGVAERAGKFGGGADVFVVEIADATTRKYYRGGALAGDPLERTRVNSLRGMTWDAVLDAAKQVYDKQVVKLRQQYGEDVTAEDLTAIKGQAALAAARDVYNATFETDVANKPGHWVGAIPVPRMLRREYPGLRTNDEVAAWDKKYLLDVLESNVWHAGPTTWAPEPGYPRGRPRLDKVGTGEGGQMFGWGWYSAENEAVSGPKGRYAETFSKYAQRDNPVLYKGQPIESYNGPLRLVLEAYQDLGTKDRLKALEMLQTNRDVTEASFFAKDPLVDFGEVSPELERYDAALRLFEQVDPKDLELPMAFVVRLNIPDADIQRMLQWEKPLSEQTPQVRAALTNATGSLGQRVRALAKDPNVTAEGLYNGIMYELPPVQGEHFKKKVSEYLRSLGIVGNKYLDQGSRGTGSWTVTYKTADGTDKTMSGLSQKTADLYKQNYPNAVVTQAPDTFNYVVWDQDVLNHVGTQHLDWQTGEILESRPLTISASWWRSGVATAVASAPQQKAAPQQWVGWLKNQPGVKQEEIDDLGLEDWLLAQEESVQKADVEKFVRDGGVRIEEIQKGPLTQAQLDKLKEYDRRITGGEQLPAVEAQEYDELTNREAFPSKAGPKFAAYQVPGGENYRELLITVPRKEVQPKETVGVRERENEPGVWELYDIATGKVRKGSSFGDRGSAEMIAAQINKPTVDLNNDYRGSHWSEPNALVHIRFDERTDVDGKRVLFVEEVQSDWGQEGRKKGYKTENGQQQLKTLDTEIETLRAGLPSWIADKALLGNFEYPPDTLGGKNERRFAEAVQERRELLAVESREAVPNMPLKSAWPLLGMKRAIRWAAEHGFDAVAWHKDPQTIKHVGGWADLEQRGDQWFANGDQNVTSIVNRYVRDLPRELSKYGKKFGAKVGETEIPTHKYVDLPFEEDPIGGGERVATTQPVWSLPITPALREEALSGQLLYSLPFSGWELPKSFHTSPLSVYPEDFNVPGTFNKIFHGMVDRFNYVKDKSPDLYRAFDEWKNRQGAMQQEIQRMYLDPMRHWVSRYAPLAGDSDPIRKTELASAKIADKNHQYSTVEIVGHQLAARHILEDNVTEQLALKAAPAFLKELKKQLSPHNVGLLNDEIKLLTGGSVQISKLSTTDARQLFESYLASANLQSDIGQRWVLWNRRSAGYSIATPGSIEAQQDAALGFINAYELYTQQVKDREIFKRIAELSDKLAVHQLSMLQEGDLLQQADVDRLSRAYPHYVPLRREAFDYDRELAEMFDKPVANVGKLMTREGSIASESASAVHVLQNHLAAGFAAASAAARNQMMNKFADVLYQDINGWKPWFYIKKEKVHKNDIGFIRGGATLYIVPAEGNLRAASIIKVIAGKDAEQLSGPFTVMRHINNWIRWTNVSASPAFMLANTPRDYLTARYNLLATDAAAYAKEIGSMKSYKESYKALYKVLVQGVRETTDPQVQSWIDLVEDFEKSGGKTSFVEALKAMDGDSWKSFEAQVGRREGKKGAVVEWGRDKLEWLENLNIVLENVMRLSTYKVMRDKVGKERAAEIARNLTTNFTRKGAHIDAINTWWLFYNATVQGNWQVVQNLFFNPNKAGQRRLQKAVGATVFFAFMIDQLGRAFSDDEDKDGISDWDSRPANDKDRKISSPFKDPITGTYLSIPAPWVFNIFWRMGGMLGEVKDGVLKPQDALLDSIALTMNAMDPVGGFKALSGEGTMAQSISPTAFDPFMQMIENRDFRGNPLGPDGYPGASKRPDAYLTWDSTPQGFKTAAQFVNEMTGGSPVESGKADFRPSSYKVLWDTIWGGVGRTGWDLAGLMGAPFSEEEFKGAEKLPLVKTFLTAPNDSTAISLYHDRAAQVLGAKRLEKLYSEGPEQNPQKLAEVQQARAAVLRMVPQIEDTERQIKALRKTLRSAQARGDSRTEEQLRERIVTLQKRFNSSYSRRVGN